jgi:phenylpyruvate tautomerase PptA (4-oxalocrotonate tautomerase family)
MPYLQFDLPAVYSGDRKRRLAERAGRIYASLMQTTPRIVKVAFRELGAENLYRCADEAPAGPVFVIMCDIRRGRPAAQRQTLAEALVAACAEELGAPVEAIEVEFTQHSGDEMYRHGALAADWEPTEAAVAPLQPG